MDWISEIPACHLDVACVYLTAAMLCRQTELRFFNFLSAALVQKIKAAVLADASMVMKCKSQTGNSYASHVSDLIAVRAENLHFMKSRRQLHNIKIYMFGYVFVK